MKITRTMVSLAAVLLMGATAGLFLLSGCADDTPKEYFLTGNIVVVNDCDGRQISIPNQVRVHTMLDSDVAPNRSGGEHVINLASDPAAPAAPKKIGTYRIRVSWLNVIGKPKVWERPRVLVGDKPVCETIACEEKRCKDTATDPNIPFAGETTNHDIRVVCNCVDY
ncbi:hypothetical protein ACFLQW_04620 [Candidatus Zixiibacteriota bacterium]